ncbi:sensor domain-containing protein [Acinetobacter indicus]|uniref:sensor domain-containing protein n=1 Tax=Acinetobacter indicus TaxID=756892 RepID=UPI001443A2D5|nr:EAL domain-containing protein [Acinetobacter indicus]
MSHINLLEVLKDKSKQVTPKLEKSPFQKDFIRAIEMMPQLIWVSSAGHHLYNSNFKQYLASDEQSLTAQSWLNAIHPEDAEHLCFLWESAQKSGQSFEKECRIRDRQQRYHWFLLIARNSQQLEGCDQWMISCTNIHDSAVKYRETKDTLRAHTHMLDVSVDCIKIVKPDGSLSHMNRSGCQALLGKEREKNFGMKWLDLLPPEAREKGQQAIREAIKGKNSHFPGMSINQDEVKYWDNMLTPVLNEHGETTSILCVSRDVTLQKIAEDKLRLSSEVDDLTKLINRRTFRKKTKQAIQVAKETRTLVGVMLIDLDHFKNINDTLGHQAGDHLLKVLSKRFQKYISEQVSIARLGGDEFAVVVHSVENEQQLIELAKKFAKLLDAPITYSGRVINCGMSIGCSMYPKDAREIPELMKCADTALNDLKAGGRGGIRMFDHSMLAAVQSKAEQLQTARMIIREQRIVPFYQPKVCIETGELIGFEALLRWQDAQQRYRYPKELLEAFSDYELTTKISELMQQAIFSDLQSWIKQGLQTVPVSINASPVELMRDNYAEVLLKRMQYYQIPAQLIEIEITEQSLAERGSECVIRTIHKLKQAGIRISLDDFGTGHSSLTHLRDYPVDSLKIDCDFVNRINSDKSIQAIVEAIIKLGPVLSLDIIAEGIETKEQFETLKQFGCHFGQGYLFSNAVNQDEAKQMLKAAS